MFRKNWAYDPSAQNRTQTVDNMLECLQVLQGREGWKNSAFWLFK